MPLFEKKETSILGIDIGTSSIKVIEVDRTREGHRLMTYGFVENFHRDLRNLGKEDARLTSQAIRSVVERSHCRSKRAIAALPTYAVFTSLISLPPLSGDELDSAVHWEAKKIIPLPLDEIVLDYRILNPPKKESGGLKLPFGKKESGEEEVQLKILITGAAKETVQKYTEIFSLSGLELVGLETEMFALSRSIVGTQPGEIMIVEIGSAVTDIIIMENGIPFFGRSLEMGGASLTRAIVNSLHINEKRAEQLKRDIGI
ncbi:MAG: pilus assembly protein PilM, partial [Patescibacteria group bacterium]